MVAGLMADAPASLGPMMLIEQGLEAVAATRFEGRLDYLRTRRGAVQTDEGLRERELRKLSVLSEAISRGFVNRGLDELTATVTAQIAVTVFSVSVSRWLDHDAEQPLTELLHETLGALQSVITDPDQQPHEASASTPTTPRTSR